MRTIKFRFRLKLICDNWGKYKKGDIDVFYITLESLCRFPIDAHWEILSQDEFTGLTDKNGVDIYEGQLIFNDDRNEKGVVKYDSDKCMFVVEYLDSKDSFPLWQSISNLYYSIGNTYEN